MLQRRIGHTSIVPKMNNRKGAEKKQLEIEWKLTVMVLEMNTLR